MHGDFANHIFRIDLNALTFKHLSSADKSAKVRCYLESWADLLLSEKISQFNDESLVKLPPPASGRPQDGTAWTVQEVADMPVAVWLNKPKAHDDMSMWR